ncbi:polyketide synthase [Diplodia corticola]|uniref:Polyketide synthase n=1 Tax=Diplodia corticola TaxID=236234 RepID=A0A1J9RJZ2_9PEZI|nr:polyketide synthase [Diplodia corticola]OJD40314.1 polyketide synthase [Diplodia corticola]
MTPTSEPIAIIGSGCRFPGGSSSPSELWRLLRDPRDVLQDFSDARLRLSSFYNSNKGHHGSTDVKSKSYLLTEDISVFDAAFFNTNPLEAASMDPAQRILLETVYETLEAAGYTMEQMQGTLTSVFVGLMTGDYWDITMRDTDTMPTYAASGVSRSIMSNRISYVFDLRGPSMTVDTACSSSLVALHQAVQSLRSGESTAAIVAGANMLLDPSTYIMESKLQMLSPESRCRMWDKSANGYARGEGVAAILLKPLSAALADGDDIECIIRETGVNSDGRTKGIAMPSAEAQATLIRETYKRAGLDWTLRRTGASDPIEAQAIANTFFPTSREHEESKLYVGSVKTVIGHLEGCAGLAGVLKASLAVQNRTVPANMHFATLNPAVGPFYRNLEILGNPIAWPEVSTGPRRVSVNSFGFGGTNAHAIVESYDVEKNNIARDPARGYVRGPLVFSARTESSLYASIRRFTRFIKSNPSVDLEALTSVLQEKRKAFPVKHYFSGFSREKIVENMDDFLRTACEPESNSGSVTRTESRNANETPRVLGIFTGQGAQWPSMGKALIEHCQLFRETIEHCEAFLAGLPDPPPWSLKAELLAGDTSHVSEAAFSQPLCTALQIAMVSLATAAGVKFSAVVGHSSGEIAAAYAAGVLSAADAMAISYYRGFHAKLAEGKDGRKGGMMAVGMTYATALELCARPQWEGRIGLAASNAPSSVTLSGDADAIMEAKAVFDEHKTFARELQVDTAYHSHHMLPCAGPYLESLLACKIRPNKPRLNCTWMSSVLGDASLLNGSLETLSGQYWVDNMVKPVLFSQALETTVSRDAFDVAVEVGPHPALKGPATQVFQSALGSPHPYTGFMRRGDDAVAAFSSGIGFLWANLGPAFVDFSGYRRAFQGPGAAKPAVLKGLPSYAWEHDKIHWRESRISRNFRLRPQKPHELLGRRMADDSDHEMRWRNFLRLSELPWLRGHEFQGQALFPATGHVAMALEAARNLAGDRAVRLFELGNVSIQKAMVVGQDQPGVETVFALRVVNEDLPWGESSRQDILKAEFSTSACFDQAAGQLEKVACGTVIIHFGESTGEELPPPEPVSQGLNPVDIDRVYHSLADIGLNYHGPFRSMVRAERRRNHCRASATWQDHDMPPEYMIHPAFLDVSFQAMFVALTSPATNAALWTTYLPSSIERITVDPTTCHDYSSPAVTADIEAFITDSSSSSFAGDVHVLDPTRARSSIQVQGLRLKAIAEASPANDRLLFAKTAWDVDIFHKASVAVEQKPNAHAEDLELLYTIERVALFYLQDLVNSFSQDDTNTISWYHQRLLTAGSAALSRVRSGHNALVPSKWLHSDTPSTIAALHAAHPHSIDLAMLHAVSTHLAPSIRTSTPILQHMLADDLLPRFYTSCWGNAASNASVARLVAQITHKHPRAHILEIGAGTGGTTHAILDAVGPRYAAYTYTDVSPGFFGAAATRFARHAHKMAFRVLDISRDPARQQGFEAGPGAQHDVVVAANVLHATPELAATVANVRKLLRPGGYLVLLEITADSLRNLVVFGGLPGWWLGAEEGRSGGPFVSDVQWDGLLRRGGFSGVDAVVRDWPDARAHGCSVMVSQAVDGTVGMLREPLGAVGAGMPEPERVVVVGGKTLPVLKVVRAVQELLGAWKERIVVVDGLDAVDADALVPGTSVICLAELNRPLFADAMTDDRLEKLRGLFSSAKAVLWATAGDPESRMTVGIGRALLTEMPNLTLQFLEVRNRAELTATTVVECFLRLVLSSETAVSEHDMLWTIEPEVALDEGELLLPRVVPDKAVNRRFNAERRLVTKTVSTEDACVQIDTLGRYSPKILLETMTPGGPDRTVIDVQYSTTFSEDCTLCLGEIRGNSAPAVALSSTAASAISGMEKHISLPDGYSSGYALLTDIASHALALELLKLAPLDYSLLVHDAPQQLVRALRYSAMAQGIRVFFSTSKVSESVGGCLQLHNMACERTIRRSIPRTVRCFVDLGSSPSSTIPRCLLPGSAVYRFRNCTGIITSVAGVSLDEALAKAVGYPLGEPARETLIDVQDLKGSFNSSANYPYVVHWEKTELEVAIPPLCPAGLFKPDKTYLMVGMAGDIGRSLAGYMIDNGARHIALASRSASVDASWLREMATLGATVRVYQMDVSDKVSVHSVYNTVRDTMPAIAGVCNAAMVLSDGLFVNTDAVSLNDVLRPKVDGTKILDELFNEPNSLDFFILFSSLASVFGNAGQSNYHAANLFMNGLAAQRRRRGLAASIMHIGMVADIGYVARAGRHIEDHLRKLMYHPMAETDLHHLFAEAVVSSDPGFRGNWDIISGIDPFVDTPDATSRRPPFYSNPRFSHFVHEATAFEQRSDSGPLAVRDVKHRLDEVGSEEDAVALIQEAFLETLEQMLQMGRGTAGANASLLSLGMDSLVAVELRTWFLKNIGVDVAVLGLLSGDTVAAICKDVAGKYMAAKRNTQ